MSEKYSFLCGQYTATGVNLTIFILFLFFLASTVEFIKKTGVQPASLISDFVSRLESKASAPYGPRNRAGSYDQRRQRQICPPGAASSCFPLDAREYIARQRLPCRQGGVHSKAWHESSN
jgi:hypothetical protein